MGVRSKPDTRWVRSIWFWATCPGQETIIGTHSQRLIQRQLGKQPMAADRVAVIGGEYQQRVFGMGRILEGIEDPADRGVDHLDLAVVAPGVVAPHGFRPPPLRCDTPRRTCEQKRFRLAGVVLEIGGQGGQLGFEYRVGKLRQRLGVQSHPTANIVRIHQPHAQEERRTGRAVVKNASHAREMAASLWSPTGQASWSTWKLSFTSRPVTCSLPT